VFFARTNEATIRVLSAEGFDVVVPPAAGCCGALHMHSGAETEARERARATIAAFEGCATVAVNAAGCGSAMKEYGRLLAGDPEWAERAEAFSAKVADVTEVLAGVEPRAPRHPVPLTVVYHDACHLAHAQGVRAEPRTVLAGIPGLTVVQPAEWEICCGSAGLYNLLEPEPAAELGGRKASGLTREALAFVADLQRRFGPGRERILAARADRWARLRAGEPPGFLPETAAVRNGDWQVAPAPPALANRRVEITGPTEAK